MTLDDKALAKQATSPETGLQSLTDINFQELFQFEDRPITLDSSECWMLNNKVMPYGKGSRRLGVAMGVEYLMPDRIFVEGEYHSNPYIVRDENHKAIGIYIVKHGIAIAEEGIRYLQPNLDYVDLTALVAAMAMNTMDKVLGESKDGAKNCTRTVFNKMKEMWKKPGDPDWFFIPTLDDETGIAFNQNEKGKAGEAIRKLGTDITMMKRNPLRKIQTATDRLVFEKLFPEAITAVDDKSVVKCDNYGKVKGQTDDKYLTKVKSATWTVRVPTQAPIARQMLTEFGIALRDNDPKAREQKLGVIMGVLGGNVQVKQLASSPIDSDGVVQEYKDGEEVETTDRIKACPAKMTLKEFKVYFNTEFRKMTDDQKQRVLDASSFETWDGFTLRKVDLESIMEVFHDVAGIAPETSTDTPDPDTMRSIMIDWFVERDGKAGFLDDILKEYGFSADSDFAKIPDDKIRAIYSVFLGKFQVEQEKQRAEATGDGEKGKSGELFEKGKKS